MDKAGLGRLAIAKAALAAELLRPGSEDDKPSADNIKATHAAIASALRQNSTANVKTAKYVLLSHIVPYPSRVTALGKYLAALSPTLTRARARLYVLYLISDVLHHTHRSEPANESFKQGIQPFLPALFAAAWQAPKLRTELSALVELWNERAYFHRFFLESLTTAALPETSKPEPSRPKPVKMPAYLGDWNDKYYDLPVSCMLPEIQGAMPVPIDAVRPIKLKLNGAGNVPDDVAQALQEFYDSSNWTRRFKEADDTAKEAYVYEGWSLEFLNTQSSRSSRSMSSSRSRSRSRSKSRSLSPGPRSRPAPTAQYPPYPPHAPPTMYYPPPPPPQHSYPPPQHYPPPPIQPYPARQSHGSAVPPPPPGDYPMSYMGHARRH